MSKSMLGSDEKLLETWRQRLVVFRIDPNQLAYTDNGNVANGVFGQVRKAIFTPSALNQSDGATTGLHEDHPNGVAVAVKEFKIHLGVDVDRFEKRLIREVYGWSQLTNDHILEFLGFYYSCLDGNIEALLVCPWLENGQSVRYVDQENIPPAQRLRLLLDAAEGLHYLHTRQPPICHGNVKGSNVLIKNNGRATICDFGLAQVLDDDFEEIASQTIFRSAIRWTSPERLDGNRSLAPPADVWSWGWLIWELTTGKIPFHSINNSSSVIYHIVSLKLPACEEEGAIAEVPALARLMRMCWQRDPDSRLKMRECINFMQRIIRELDPQGTVETEQGEPEGSLDFSRLPLAYSPAPRMISPMAFGFSESPVAKTADDGKILPTPIPSPPQDVRSVKSSSLARPKTIPRPPRLVRETSGSIAKDLPPLPDPPKASPSRTVESVFPEEHPRPYVFKLENSPPIPSSSRNKLGGDSYLDARVSLEAAYGTEAGSSRHASLPGLLGITKSLFRTSKKPRKVSSDAPLVDVYQRAGTDYEYNPWDSLDVPRSNINSPSSATNGSEPATIDESEFSNAQFDRLQRAIQRIESSQAQYLQEQREIKQYLSQVGQWLSQAPIFRAPAPPPPAIRINSISSPLAPPPVKSVPNTPSAISKESTAPPDFSSSVNPGQEDQSWLSRPAGARQPVHGRPKEYNSVNLAAMALRDAMLSNESIPLAVGTTASGSRLSRSSVQSLPVYEPGDTITAGEAPPAASERSSSKLIKEEEIQIHGAATQEAKASVLKAVIVATGRVVAVKCLGFQLNSQLGNQDHSLSAWMERWASREHPNVAKLVGRTFLDSAPAIVSDWYPSGNITDYLRDNPQADRKSLLRQVAEGLEHLHQNPTILHTNLKPSNVLVDGDGKVKLSDVGIALFLTIANGVDIHGKSGDARWIAPEILEGELYSSASDVYAFGCLALVVLKDRTPYAMLGTDVGVSKAICRGELPVDWEFASGLHPMWRLCWNQSPPQRPTMRAILGSVGYWEIWGSL